MIFERETKIRTLYAEYLKASKTIIQSNENQKVLNIKNDKTSKNIIKSEDKHLIKTEENKPINYI